MSLHDKQIKISNPFGQDFEIGEFMALNLQILVEAALKNNQDVVLIYDGEEGAGKSTLMRQHASYIHLKLNEWGYKSPLTMANIKFDLQEYLDASVNAAKQGIKGYINILDESRRALGRQKSGHKDVIRFTDFFSECRFSNQVHLIALPRFHDLHKNIAISRMKLLIHLEKSWQQDEKRLSGYKLVLGNYKVYSINKQKAALIKCFMQRESYYNYPKSAFFYGRFHFAEPIKGIEDYNDQKLENLYINYHSDNLNKKKEVDKPDLEKIQTGKLIFYGDN